MASSFGGNARGVDTVVLILHVTHRFRPYPSTLYPKIVPSLYNPGPVGGAVTYPRAADFALGSQLVHHSGRVATQLLRTDQGDESFHICPKRRTRPGYLTRLEATVHPSSLWRILALQLQYLVYAYPSKMRLIDGGPYATLQPVSGRSSALGPGEPPPRSPQPTFASRTHDAHKSLVHGGFA